MPRITLRSWFAFVAHRTSPSRSLTLSRNQLFATLTTTVICRLSKTCNGEQLGDPYCNAGRTDDVTVASLQKGHFVCRSQSNSSNSSNSSTPSNSPSSNRRALQQVQHRSADLHGGPTTAASAWPGPAYTETSVIGSEDGDIVLGERLDIAAAIARDDPGSSEHGGCQESKNRDLHGSDRPIGSRSVMAVGTRTGTVPYWRMRWMDDDKHRLHSERFV